MTVQMTRIDKDGDGSNQELRNIVILDETSVAS